jgi:aspartate carbamoyltransferase catalytic subunit
MVKGQVSLRGKDILGLENMSVPEMKLILTTAKEMKGIIGRDIKKVHGPELLLN